MLLSVVSLCIMAVLAQEEEESYTPVVTKSKRVTYDDPDPYKNLMDWLRDGKAEVSKVYIEQQSEGHRTLRAAQNIRQGEWILFIPQTHYLSIEEVKKSCLINRKMIQVNHLPNNLQVYFVNHMLQERRRKNSFWKPYIDVLPTDVSGFPSYFDEEQLALLKGSPTLLQVMNQRKLFREEYDEMFESFAEFRKYGYSYDDYVKFRILTISRSFPTFFGENEQQQLLVPLADFVNHDNNGFIRYGYSPEQGGFFMMAARNIIKGEELFYNYGQWSNKYFFMNYGFALLTNPMNQFDMDLCLNQDDRLYNIKVEMTKGNVCWFNRLVNETDHDTLRQSLGTSRFIMMNRLDQVMQLEDEVANYQMFWPGWHTRPVSTELEIRTFTHLRDNLQLHLNNYASTIADDQQRLNDPSTPEFRRHIIVLTMQEKQTIVRNLDAINLMLTVLDKTSDQLKDLMRYYNYREIARYVNTVIIPIKVEEEQ